MDDRLIEAALVGPGCILLLFAIRGLANFILNRLPDGLLKEILSAGKKEP